ncbi:helix-turn-helix transcriptional regulator [Acinetobacter radioresistens]|uniref:helix-turn-helix transcriptional regulator n=1 Tax=Acinetobacter radioresistens TaxID=40216 RepID=UPI0022464BB9|nr:AlpA family phage regulatory protein [Acinetobacter radioresistens]MCX0332464.1 AlpA family phage regulatory protein [Acinetobacter radioresistens]
MLVQNQHIYRRLLERELWKISELASTAERHSRIYKTKDGKTRVIKGRPARFGILCMGESTIWEKVRKGDMPAPIKLSERVRAWRTVDLIEWLESKSHV